MTGTGVVPLAVTPKKTPRIARRFRSGMTPKKRSVTWKPNA
jgi:hypothetical protein